MPENEFRFYCPTIIEIRKIACSLKLMNYIPDETLHMLTEIIIKTLSKLIIRIECKRYTFKANR